MTGRENHQLTELQNSVAGIAEIMRAHGADLAAVKADVLDLKTTVKAMAPTVSAVSDTLTFAKVGRRLVATLATIGVAGTAAVAWVTGNADLLKRLFLVR